MSHAKLRRGGPGRPFVAAVPIGVINPNVLQSGNWVILHGQKHKARFVRNRKDGMGYIVPPTSRRSISNAEFLLAVGVDVSEVETRVG